MMNREAQRPAWWNTHFTGHRPVDAQHYTTARDLAIRWRLSATPGRLFNVYALQKEFSYNQHPQRNATACCDRSRRRWVKTGHTDNASYCLIASAKRGERRLPPW